MEILKKLAKALLFPPVAIVILLVPVAATMLIYAFAFENAHGAIVYGSYFLSAYALTLVCVRAPWFIKKAKAIKADNKYIQRYVSDPHLRVKISLYGSLFINTAYALFQLALGIHHASVWFYALAGYYVLLALMRYFLLKETVKSRPGEDRFMELLHYRFCGVLFLLMNTALAVIVAYIVGQGRSFEHHPVTTIAMAAYTFSALSMAIVGLVRYRRYESPVYSAAKAISLAAASVSMLTLEAAMLSTFGQEGTEGFYTIMTGATGAAVCLFVMGLAVFMIARSTKEIKEIKRNGR